MDSLAKMSNSVLATINIESSTSTFNQSPNFLFARIGSELGMPALHFHVDILNAHSIEQISAEVLHAAKATQRTKLFLAGAYLETQVTFLTLGALAEGFAVYLINDFILAHDFRHEEGFRLRLYQAGATPSTLEQCLSEWRASTNEQDVAQKLDRLLEEAKQRSNFGK